MKVYVYYHDLTGHVSCYLEPQSKSIGRFIQEIEATPTDEEITIEFQSRIFIEIGEVFACNSYIGNLKRIS